MRNNGHLDPFDPRNLCGTAEDVAKWQQEEAVERRKREAKGNKLPRYPKTKGFQFHMFPAGPLEMLAVRAQYPALAVLCVLSRLWFKNSCHNPVTLTTDAVQNLGLSRHQKRRTLALLEESGLITVEQKNGKNPRITLNWRPH
jgi:hypothetical protein